MASHLDRGSPAASRLGAVLAGPSGSLSLIRPGSRSRLAAVCRPPASGPHPASALAPQSTGGRGGRRPRAWPEPTRGAERGSDEGPPQLVPRSDFLLWDTSSKRKRQTELHAQQRFTSSSIKCLPLRASSWKSGSQAAVTLGNFSLSGTLRPVCADGV